MGVQLGGGGDGEDKELAGENCDQNISYEKDFSQQKK